MLGLDLGVCGLLARRPLDRPVLVRPVNTALPSITGMPEVTRTLSCGQGTWTGKAPISYAYGWTRNGAAIPGATAGSYVLDTADDGATVSCIVTATDEGGSTSVSAAGVSVTYRAPVAAGGIADRSWVVDEPIAALDIASDFSGSSIVYALAPSSVALPEGLALSAAGVLTGTPVATAPSINIVVRGTNSGGFADTAFGAAITAVGDTVAPVISNLVIDDSTDPIGVAFDISENATLHGIWTVDNEQAGITPDNVIAGKLADGITDAPRSFSQTETEPSGSFIDDISALPDGTVRFYLVAVDAAGNTSSVVSGSFVRAASGPYSAKAVDSDGGVYGKATPFNGTSAGKTGTLSVWLYQDSASWVSNDLIFSARDTGTNNPLVLSTESSGRISIEGENTAGTRILRILSASGSAVLESQKWNHVLMSWDLAAGEVHCYINDTEAAGATTATDDTLPAWDSLGVFANEFGVANFDGFLADLYVDEAYLDLSVEANRRSFIDDAGKPVDLSAYGSPILLLNGDETDFFTNPGSGSNLIETDGTLAAAASSPSE